MPTTTSLAQPTSTPPPTEDDDRHEHGWTIESAHPTSQGRVLYVRCRCGARRVDVQAGPDTPPVGLSVVVN